MYFTYLFSSQIGILSELCVLQVFHFVALPRLRRYFTDSSTEKWQKESMLNVQVCRKGIKSASWCCLKYCWFPPVFGMGIIQWLFNLLYLCH